MEKRSRYKRKIIKELYFSRALSCAELCTRTGKSFPIVTTLLDELVQDGTVIETGFAPSKGGRRPLNYALNNRVLYVVSVAMDQFVTRIAVMDMQNHAVVPVEKFELPLPNNPQALTLLCEKLNEVLQRSGIEKKKIAGIGIGMPGFVNVRKGINYSFLSSSGRSITQVISESIGLPVFIDNDSSLIALAELRFGAVQDTKNVMVINIGWGIGLGLVLNGELFRGADGFAGEFSHIPLFLNGKLCSCGKHGCLETEASLLEVIEKAANGLKEGRISKLKALPADRYEQASEAIMAAAHEGDQFAVELLSEAGYTIGRGVAILIHLLNPDLIILSGRGSLAGRLWLAPIQQALNEYCIPRLAHGTTIELSTLGYDAELIGAATLVMENYEKALVDKAEAAQSDSKAVAE